MTTIQPKRITAEGFAPYGTVAKLPAGRPTAEDETFTYWSDAARYLIDGETEIGYCRVYRKNDQGVTWMERHERTPELLIPIDMPFILPVMEDDRVEAFRVEPGEAIVIGQNVWHSACQPDGADRATYFVIFRRGTPQEDVIKTDLEDVTLGRM